MDETNFVEINRHLWNAKVDYHVASSMYDVPAFLNGKNSLNQIEIDLLGNLHGKRILHLQCHFGMDSLSLVRQGAAHVTGVDFSPRAIAKAQELAETIHLTESVRFVCCNIYELDQHLSTDSDPLFDVVFTSYGVVGWLPDLQKWASIISRYLKPNGNLIMAEFHPVLWMFDDTFTRIEESYFNQKALFFQNQGTYANRNAPICNKSVEWNHSLTEILQALIDHHLRLDKIEEFDYSPYNCFQNTVQTKDGFYQIKGLENKIPMIFALRATKSING